MLLTPDALNAALDALAHGSSGDPFAILGPHVVHTGGTSRVVILTIQPSAARVEVVRLGPGDARSLIEMRRLPQGIIFAAQFVGEAQVFDYRLRVTTMDGQTFELDDPYRYGQVMGELDLHLLGEGRHYRAFERLGSHALRSDRRRARISRCGRPTPSASAWSATSTSGTAWPIRCAGWCRTASGSCSSPASAPASATSSSCAAGDRRRSSRPIRTRASSRRRRPRRR